MWCYFLNMITNKKIGYNGRFGNQLFQFSSLLGIADKVGFKAVVPKSNKTGFTQRSMDGKNFQSKFELHECFDISDSYFSDDIKSENIKNESTFHFDSTFFEISDFTSIDGYFQSEKYFSHIKKELLEILKFKQEILDNAYNLLPKFENKELVSIHVRRGDYTTPNQYHPVVSDTYLNKCLSHFNDERYHFVIFSDDIEWCKSKWGENERFTYFSSNSHFVDFCAMSLCHHHITSNSSYSWWSSYLCQHENKKVFAPKKWFGPGYAHYIIDDLYRVDMIVIDENIEENEPLEPVVSVEIENEKEFKTTNTKINVFTICTGKYITYFEQFYKSCQDKFLPEYEKKYFVFTDGELPEYDNVVKIQQNKLGWPFDTMMRFKMFNSAEHLLDGDYVYFFNINMQFLQTINDEVLPGKENNWLMGVNHPGYYNKNCLGFPYERSSLSNFYVPFGMGNFYYQGCFNGGRKEEFMQMSKRLEQLIDDDVSKKIIPVWHDESALNWYYVDRNPLLLDSSYAYPESSNLPFDRKIIQIDKNKHGGHSYLRN